VDYTDQTIVAGITLVILIGFFTVIAVLERLYDKLRTSTCAICYHPKTSHVETMGAFALCIKCYNENNGSLCDVGIQIKRKGK